MPYTDIPPFDPARIPNPNDEANFHVDASYVWEHMAGEVLPKLSDNLNWINGAVAGINQTVVDTQAAMLAGTTDVYTKGNILGAVSEAAGVPTGAIIQRGSNSNGEFVRFADGTQICERTVNFSGVINAVGSMFESFTYVWDFPATFAEPPTLAQTSGNMRAWATTRSTVTQGSIRLLAPASLNTAISGTAVAIGRWF